MRTEAELIEGARHGDEAAFAVLVDSHHSRLRLHCYRMLGLFHDADDAVQEALLRAWLNIRRFEARRAFGTWLYRISTNVCLNVIRKRPRIVVPDAYAATRPIGRGGGPGSRNDGPGSEFVAAAGACSARQHT